MIGRRRYPAGSAGSSTRAGPSGAHLSRSRRRAARPRSTPRRELLVLPGVATGSAGSSRERPRPDARPRSSPRRAPPHPLRDERALCVGHPGQVGDRHGLGGRLLVDAARPARRSRSGVSSTTPLGGATKPAWVGAAAWHETQRSLTIACTRAKSGSPPPLPADRGMIATARTTSVSAPAASGSGEAPSLVPRDEPHADQRARHGERDQDQPVPGMIGGERVVVADHREQHRQREIGVVHGALLAAQPVDSGRARALLASPAPSRAGRG